MKPPAQAKNPTPDPADLRRRLARLRSRVAGESRPRALLVIDEAIEDARVRGKTGE